MRTKLTMWLLFVAAAVLVFGSCKKKEEETVYKYINGTVKFGTLPQYVTAGQSFNFTPSGAYREDDADDLKVGYILYSSLSTVRDTLKKENEASPRTGIITIPADTLCTFTVTMSAYAKDYVSTSSSLTSTIVDPTPVTGSLTGIDIPAAAPFITDGRDGKKFVSAYMLSRTVKLLSCLLFLLLYMFLKPDDAIRFAIAFLVIYFLYAIFEIVVLKKENETKKDNE